MPEAFLPSPASAVWHLGPIPVRAFSLCMVAGVVVGLWLTDRRYRKAGGHAGVILAVATVAVPVGIIGARIYSVVTNAHLYFGAGRDWVDAVRFWNGGLGVAGAVAAGALAAWIYCRRAGIDIGPLALAAAPALPVAQAIAVWGNWFSQSLYGRPSGLPWAVAIAPSHRAVDFQAAATFQPIFLYESVLYLLVALAVGYGIRRFSLSGDLAFALYAGLYATARFCVEAQRIDYTPRLFGLRTNEVAMLVVLVAAWSYFLVVEHRHHQRTLDLAAIASPAARPLRPRSDTAIAAEAGQVPAEPGGAMGPAGAPGPARAAGAAGPARAAGAAGPARAAGEPARAAGAASEPASTGP